MRKLTVDQNIIRVIIILLLLFLMKKHFISKIIEKMVVGSLSFQTR